MYFVSYRSSLLEERCHMDLSTASYECRVEHFIGVRSPPCLSGDYEEIDVVNFEDIGGFVGSSGFALSAKVVR
jgi:hypothetical protein